MKFNKIYLKKFSTNTKVCSFYPKEGEAFRSLEKKMNEMKIPIYSLNSNNSDIKNNIKNFENADKIEVLHLNPFHSDFILDALKKFNNLKWIYSSYAGINRFLPYAKQIKEKGISFSNAKGCFDIGLAELVFSNILYWERMLYHFQENKQSGKRNCNPIYTNEITRKTIGIVGYGSIGSEVGRIAKNGFKMEVIGLKNNTKGDFIGKEYLDEVIDSSKLHYLLSKSDYVVDILPETPKTNNIFNKETFSLMKKNSIFINIGRGNSVNESDLIEFLKNKKTLRCASLDVTKEEPLSSNSELWDLENCQLTLHTGNFPLDDAGSEEVPNVLFANILQNEFLKGKVQTNLVDLERGY